MRAGRACAAWGLALAIALTGCSGGDEQVGGPIPSGPPADPTSSQTTPAAHDGPPELPALAREHTNAGAKAFVRYYIDVLNYAWIEKSGARILQLARPECGACTGIARGIDRVARHDGRQRGGAWHVESMVAIPGQALSAPILSVQIRIDRLVIRTSRNARPRPQQAHDFRFDAALQWTGHQWLISALD